MSQNFLHLLYCDTIRFTHTPLCTNILSQASMQCITIFFFIERGTCFEGRGSESHGATGISSVNALVNPYDRKWKTVLLHQFPGFPSPPPSAQETYTFLTGIALVIVKLQAGQCEQATHNQRNYIDVFLNMLHFYFICTQLLLRNILMRVHLFCTR